MLNAKENRWEAVFLTASTWIAWMTILVGSAVIIGWILNLPFLKGYPFNIVPMKFSTGIAFVLTGVSLLSAQPKPINKLFKVIGLICSTLTILIAALTLMEYALGINLGINQFFLIETAKADIIATNSGRMAMFSALNFILLNLSLILYSQKNKNIDFTAQFLSVGVGITAYQALIAYLLGVRFLTFGDTGFSMMALNSAVLFLILQAGIVFARPKSGFMLYLATNTSAGIMLRRLYPLALIIPAFLGWLKLALQNLGFISNELGVSLVAFGNATVFSVFLWLAAKTMQQREEEHIKAKEKYETMFSAAGDALMILSPPDWRFTDGNEATLKIFKVQNVEQFMQLGPWELSPETQPDGSLSMEKARKMIELALKNGTNYFEWTHKRYKGASFSASVLLSKIDVNGVAMIQAIVRDISERKRIENELLQFKLGIERTDAAVFTTDLNGNITYVNPAFEKIYGYKAEEAIGKTPRIIKSGVLGKEIYADFWKTLLNKQVVSGEIVNKTKDGRIITAEGSTSPILDDQKNILGFLSIQRDVSSRKKANEELAYARRFTDSIINSVGDPIFVKNRAHQWILLNDAFCLFMGYPREKLLGKTDSDFFPKEEAAVFWNKDEEVFRSQKENINEESFTDAKGFTHTIITKKVLFKGEQEELYVVGIIRDITELKDRSEALEKINKIMVGRELRMVELKEEIARLKGEKQ